MADIASLIKALKDTAVAQYDKGAPYRQALASAIRGDMSGVNQALSQSELTPTDFAMSFAPMGMFIGKSSAAFNPSKADLFAQLEAKGVSPQEAWRQTGTLRGPEGALRQEISDRKSIAIPMSEWGWGARADAQAKNSTGGLLNEFLKHNELNKSYPDALNTWTRIVPRENAGGSYSIDDLGRHKIQLGLKEKGIDKSTALHELQHLIQQEEGFAKGGSPDEIGTYLQQSNPELYTKLIKSGELNNPDYLMNAYKNLAGEAEARLTENRMDLTPQQRLKHFPYNQGKFGLDVPFESLTVRK